MSRALINHHGCCSHGAASSSADTVRHVEKKPLKTDSLHACPFAAGDTNDNKTAVGPEDVSKMGCPCLGEHTKLEVIIEESYEFKVMLVTSELQQRVTLSLAYSSMWLHRSNEIMATFHTDVFWCFILPSVSLSRWPRDNSNNKEQCYKIIFPIPNEIHKNKHKKCLKLYFQCSEKCRLTTFYKTNKGHLLCMILRSNVEWRYSESSALPLQPCWFWPIMLLTYDFITQHHNISHNMLVPLHCE